MNWRRLFFIVPALLSAFAVTKVALVPLSILYGKLPEPESDLLLRVLGKQVAPIAGIGVVSILLALRFYLRGAPVQRWALLLLGAPVFAFAMLYFSFGWTP